jgi:hypothetical protein
MSNGLGIAARNRRDGSRFRYDPGDAGAVNRGLGWSLALGLRPPGEPVAAGERRAEARLAPEPAAFVCRLVCQRWFSSWRREALVVNISRGGALVFLDAPPPSGGAIVLELETPRRKATVPARVLEVRPTRQGQAAVRIAFSRGWPYELLESAVCSLAPVRPRRRRTTDPRGPEGDTSANWSNA